MSKKIYRCPKCHHVIEKKQLFGEGCPICGWVSPLKNKDKEGMAESVIRQFGFGGLLDAAKKMPEFNERLKQANEQIKENIKKGYSSRPTITHGHSIRTIAKTQPRELKVGELEPLVDVFEEPNIIRVVAQLPKVEEKDIKVDTNKDEIIISAHLPNKKYYKQIRLPSLIKGKIEKSFKNGVLEIKAKKMKNDN